MQSNSNNSINQLTNDSEQSPRKNKKPQGSSLKSPIISAADVFARRRKLQKENAVVADPDFTSITGRIGGSNVSNRKVNQSLTLSKLGKPQMKKLLIAAIDRYEAEKYQTVVNAWSESNTREAKLPLLNFTSADASTLTIEDVPRLLAEYKLLVKACAVFAVDNCGSL